MRKRVCVFVCVCVCVCVCVKERQRDLLLYSPRCLAQCFTAPTKVRNVSILVVGMSWHSAAVSSAPCRLLRDLLSIFERACAGMFEAVHLLEVLIGVEAGS